jgi:hypothetical protein
MTSIPRVAASAAAALALAVGTGAPAALGTASPAALGTGSRAAQQPGSPARVPTAAGHPLHLSLSPAVGSVDSLNSAGYVVSRRRTRFRSVRATFFVPYLNCALSPGGRSSDWVGLDGFVRRPDSVEQDGIEADCDSAGRPVYHAWYAMYPRRRTTARVTIRSGDSVTASVFFDLADRTFSLALTDNTTGGHFRVQAKCRRGLRCPRSSAEVISSAPATGKPGHLRIGPLADYGAVSYAAIAVTSRSGRRGGLRSAHWAATRIVETQRTTPFRVIARPTLIEGGTFDVYWVRGS